MARKKSEKPAEKTEEKQEADQPTTVIPRTENEVSSEDVDYTRYDGAVMESRHTDELSYLLLNISTNMWVGPNGTVVNDMADAVKFPRLEALDQLADAINNNASDYNLPVRCVDLLNASMPAAE